MERASFHFALERFYLHRVLYCQYQGMTSIQICPPTREEGNERSDIRKALLKSLRPLPLMHNWTFWYDRYNLSTMVNDLLADICHLRRNTMTASRKLHNSTLSRFTWIPSWLTNNRTFGEYSITCLWRYPRGILSTCSRRA